MRRNRFAVVLGALVGALLSAPVGAQSPAAPAQAATAAQPTLRFGGETAVVSYVWRGFVESDVPCLQPGGWVGFGPVSVDAWMNLEIADEGFRVAEYDVSLIYTHEWDRVSVAGGLTNYFFDTPDGGRERHSELALSLSGGGLLNPSIEAYYSISAEKGAHVTTSVSHPWRVASQIVFTAEAALGYNHRMWIDRSGFTDLRGTLKLSLVNPSERVRFDVGIDYSHALMPSLFSNRLVGVIGIYGE